MYGDLKLRNRSDGAIYEYLRCGHQLARYHMLAPERMGQTHVRRFFLHLTEERKLSPGALRVYVGAIKFLFGVTLGRPNVVAWLAYPRMPKKLPEVLSLEEVRTLLAATDGRRTRCWLMAGYGAGLRVSEVARLRPEHIRADRGIIQVHAGKGAKDRQVPLSPVLLAELRAWWVEARPEGGWLFPGAVPGAPITSGTIQNHFHKARRAAGLREGLTFHSLRRSFATHQLEAKVDLATVQAVLGHASLETSLRYIRLRTDHLVAAGTPLDRLQGGLDRPRN
jgi:integrase